MGSFTFQRPTARRLRFSVQIQSKHELPDAKQKLNAIEKELRKLVAAYKKTAAKRRGKRR